MDGKDRQNGLGDEALAALVSQRDVVAFSVLYERYSQSVYAFAAHTLGAKDAEEVVQEVFLRLWQRASQFDPARGSFGAWFMAAARHRIVDDLRRRNNQKALGAADEIERVLMRAIDPLANVEQEAVLRERNAEVLLAVRELPLEQRQALLLAYFAGLTQSAIAEHLGWPLGTVKKRIRLGLQKLRTALAEERITAAPIERQR